MWDVTRFVRRVSAFGTLCLLAACNGKGNEPTPSTTAAAAAPTADAAPSDAAPEAKPGVPTLTEEDIRIINADPATLTPEERRKRPFALRRKILQNPDSPAAKSLEDLRKATEAGEIEPPTGLVKFEARGAGETPPAGGPPPAGSRPTEATKSAQ